MSSQGETQIRAILGDSLSNTRLLVMFGVFGIAVLIAISIKDNNLKICFWLSLILIIICLINLNLSISFYIKLRNDKGIQGPRGERGLRGKQGDKGLDAIYSDAFIYSDQLTLNNGKGVVKLNNIFKKKNIQYPINDKNIKLQ